MRTRTGQRFGGAVIAAIGIGFTIWIWLTIPHPGGLRTAVIMPAFAVVGIALVIFPGYREERIARGEDISALVGYRLITPRWWGVLIAALAVGAIDAALMAHAFGIARTAGS